MFTRQEPKRSIRLKSPLIPIVVFLLLGVQLFFPYKGWSILLSGFGGLWLIGYFWARALKKGLRINRDMSFGWKQVGDRLRERVLLENNSWIPSLWVHIDDHSDMRDYEISGITDVRGWRYRNWHTQGVCNYRGLFTLGPVTLETEDPFGIYQVHVDYSESVNMMVVPPVVELPEIEIASGGRVGEGRSSNKGLKQTVSTIGVREYVPGDALRWLHWPTIARKGDLYVHLFENEPTSDWWVLLDMDASVQIGEGQQSTEEHGVMLAASLVNRGLQLGKHVGLVTYGDDLVWYTPDIGNAHLWSVLRSLATIHPGGPPLEQLLQRIKASLERNSSLIVITPNPSPSWISALELLKRLGIIPTVLLLDPVSFGGQGNLEAVRNHLRKLNVSHHTITADLLDRPQKQTKKAWEWLTSTRPTGEIRSNWDILWGKAKGTLRTLGFIFLFYYIFADLLDGAVRGMEINLIWYMILGGLITGGVLAVSKLSGWVVSILGGLIGALGSVLRVGSLSGKVLDAAVRIFQLLPGIYDWVFRSEDQPDFQPTLLRLNEIWTGSNALGFRLWEWGKNIWQGRSYYDPVVNTFLWSVAIWGVVFWSMWAIFRKNKVLLGFIPATTLVSITMAVIGKTPYNLIFLFGSAIALMALTLQDNRERLWLASNLNFASGIRRNILIASITISVGLMGFSLLTPSISIDSVTNFIRDIVGESDQGDENISKALGLEDQSGEAEVDVLDTIRAGGLPNEHLIGSGSELSEQVVMLVRIESPNTEMLPPPLYLRSLVYDKYTGRGWESRGTIIVEYSPGEEILLTRPENSFLVRQQVQYVEDLGGFIYTTGIPNSTDQDFRVAWRINDVRNGIYDMLGAVVAGDSYRVDSFVQMSSVDELRAAGQAYPGWINERYFVLPSTTPEKVLSLAIELTATSVTPYDRAVAIEQYLRKIPYSLSVSTGPAGADIVDYFLFSLKKGYCDYYASAMVVLARAAGIPARYAVGYLAEFYDETEGVYIVTADQAHAWPEIYFPGYGWVAFEPTGGRPAIDRPVEPIPQLPDEFEINFSPLVPENRLSFKHWPQFFGLSLIVVIIFTLVGIRVSDWWFGRLQPDTLVPKLYKRIYRYARWAGLSVKPGDTAYHFASDLNTYLTRLGEECYWADWALEGVEMISGMTEIFVHCMFNPLKEELESGEILRLYRQLRPRLWLLMLLGRAYPHRIIRPLIWRNAPLLISMPLEENK